MDLELLYKSLFGCFLVSTNPKTDFRPYEVFFRQIQIFSAKRIRSRIQIQIYAVLFRCKGSEVTPLNQGKRGTTESIEAVLDD